MYAQFEELETFARFGTQLDAETRRKLTRGLRVREVLKQREHDHIPVPAQIAVLLAATEGLFDDHEPDDVAAAEQVIRKIVPTKAPKICDKIISAEKLEAADRETLIETIRNALARSKAQAQPEAPDGDA
jgi:F-type H+-transporting ATPase subunit alpha